MNPNNQLPPVIIPAYRPSDELPLLIKKILDLGFTVFVVDDGSGEKFQPVFEKIQVLPSVSVLRNSVNLGKGAALKHAFNHILIEHPNISGAITVDADGQHLPKDVLAVANEFLKTPNALVLGSRTFHKEVPLRSRFGNILTGHIFHLLVGKKLSDTQTGLRAIPKALMKEMLPVKSNRYEFELDMLLKANKSVALKEVPIDTVYEEGNKSSHFNPILDSIRIYFIFLRFILTSFTAFIIDIIVFTICIALSKQVFASIVAGRFVSLFFITVASKNFVFKSKQAFFTVIPKMFLLWLFLLGISYGLMLVFVNEFGINIYLSRILIDSTLFLANFFIQKGLIFYSDQDDSDS
ncbi:MAG: glycosyltransferase family 2 protein [Oligoflexia bacterium]|nr:glycosyltransferase family 2 protein [Oligoflexia bacterium]